VGVVGYEWWEGFNMVGLDGWMEQMYKKWGDLNCTKHQGLWQCWIVLADVGVLKTARQ